MRWDVSAWAVIALVLYGLEVLAPGAFMLWLALAATVMMAVVWLMPGMTLLMQAVLFIVLAVVAIFAYRKWFRRHEPKSDQPALNRRVDQLVGTVVALESAIVLGTGRVQIADAYWTVSGPDLAAGTRVRIIGAEGMTLLVEQAG